MKSCSGFVNDPPRNQHAVTPSHQTVPRFRKFVELVRLKIDLARHGH
jgi:hypothetical protein